MGRRKIEIQPITHERNRSVTFLKRKNGLFKKAYELGVLCSVDVAVIIFEERPGHHVKLYQYCSTDVHGMVQRHLRFDGEKDTRTPADFSSSKAEEAVDDDDDNDDDAVTGTKGQSKARRDTHDKVNVGRIKTEAGNSSVPIRPVPTPTNEVPLTAAELDYRSARGSPPSSSIPISGERHSVIRPSPPQILPIAAKRPRLDDGQIHGISALPQTLNVASVAGSAPPQYPYRLELDLSQYPVQSHITPLSALPPAPNVSHPSLHPAFYNSSGIPPPMQPQANFLPQLSPAQFDMAQQQQQQPGLRGMSISSHMQPQSQIGSPFHPTQHSMLASARPSVPNTGAAAMAVELLSAAGDHSGSQQASFPPFDWPVHTQQQPAQQDSSPGDGGNWFDFLTGGGGTQNASPNPLAGASLFPTHARPPSSSISSASGRSVAYGLPSSERSTPSLGRKRQREDGADERSGATRRSVSVDKVPG